jgi:hypothetical protein
MLDGTGDNVRKHREGGGGGVGAEIVGHSDVHCSVVGFGATAGEDDGLRGGGINETTNVVSGLCDL